MPRYAIGHIDFFNNVLVVEILEGSTWKDALKKHSSFVVSSLEDSDAAQRYLDELPDDLKEAQEEAFNGDWAFDAVELPSEHPNKLKKSRRKAP